MSRRTPIDAGTHQRYWRRRANRRVRKARRTRSMLRWSVILLIHAVLFGALAYASLRALEQLEHSAEFALRRIELDGLRHGSADVIRARLADYSGRNLLTLDLGRIEAELRNDPWVRSASVRRVLPATLAISIVERLPIARAVIHDVDHLVDTTGYVIGPLPPSDGTRLPYFSGLERLDREGLAAALRQGAMLLLRLRRANGDFTDSIATIDLSDPDRIAVRLVDDGPPILFAADRIERNLHAFLELDDEIRQLAGPAEYIDLRWRDRISVMPAVQQTSGKDG